MTFMVSYYDPEWGLLWGEDDSVPFFLPVGRKALPMVAGQGYRIRGRFSQNNLESSPALITPISTEHHIEPVTLPNSFEDWEAVNGRTVRITVLVDSQAEIDKKHGILSTIFNGRRISVRVRMENDGELPDFVGGFVTVQGVCVRNVDPIEKLVNV